MSEETRRRTLLVAVVGVWLVIVGMATAPDVHGHLRAHLGDPTPGVQSARGRAGWVGTETRARALTVSVVGIDLPEGTQMRVDGCEGTVGWLSLRPARKGTRMVGRLHLSARRGDAVPACDVGDVITVSGRDVQIEGALSLR